MRKRGLSRNVFSYFGGLVMVLSLLLIFSFLLVSFAQSRPTPYLGILTYLIFPGTLALGVLIFVYGMIRENRRARRLGVEKPLPLPTLDLNIPRQRKKFAFFLVGGCLLLVFLSFLSYKAYLFTDSVTFCGRVCHTVMRPEYTAYLNSPHARVPCVDCHVGPGVSWYLRSKVAGVPQVFGTLLHTYPTPLRAPIESLRPARETCEQCHWPQKFYGAQLVQNPYFRHDEKNTAQQISFLVKTGGGNPKLGENAGIHWHMIIHNQVYFRAMDKEQQHIPWVQMVLPDGSKTVYRDRSRRIPDAELNKLPLYLMDCMNCHNRPAHLFPTPDAVVDRNISNGNIPSRLPWIKKLAVAALIEKYADRGRAHEAIRKTIEGHYGKNFPAVLKNQQPLVEQAVNAVLDIYDRSVFLTMKVDWKTYPDNIGHRNWPGCFRCHDGRHVSDSGKILTHACTTCHTTPQRGPLLPLGATAPASREPWHPMPLTGKHADLSCTACHQLGYPAVWGCAYCHKIEPTAPMMSAACNSCHRQEGEVRPLVSCRSCHGQLGGLHKKGGHSDVPCTTCHAPHTWKISGRDTCLTCHGDKKDHFPSQFCGQCHPFAKEAKIR